MPDPGNITRSTHRETMLDRNGGTAVQHGLRFYGIAKYFSGSWRDRARYAAVLEIEYLFIGWLSFMVNSDSSLFNILNESGVLHICTSICPWRGEKLWETRDTGNYVFFCARAIFLTGYRVSFAAARMTDRSRFDKGIEIVWKVFGFAILSFITLSRYTMFYIICSLTMIFKKLFTLLALFVDRKDCSCKELSLFFDKFSKLKGVI